VAAVTAVAGAVVFGTSLGGLISHPARYGWEWDVLIQAEGGYGSFAPGAISALLGNQPSVAGWSEFAFTQVRVGGRVIPVLGLQRGPGSAEPPVTSGHPIAGDHQIALGAVTLRELGKKIGDTVTVGAGSAARPFTIAGTVTLPSFGLQGADHVSLGRGAMLSEAALLAATGTSATQRPDPLIPLPLPSAVAIRLAPGTPPSARERLVNRIVSAQPDRNPGGTQQLTRSRAAAVVNAAQMGRQQLALALSLAAAAVLSLALTVLASVRRRRHELGLLKALGMTRGQVRVIITWQVTLTLLTAVAAGIPLGIAAGRWAWHSFAGSLGVVPVTVVPVLVLAAGSVALIAAGNLLALVPAALAARTSPGTTLRAE
jgi:predicted lysophospholipase L1 biosynthesis ABC-type transport system permease subunit